MPYLKDENALMKQLLKLIFNILKFYKPNKNTKKIM
jgi:hypothetical protein